MLMFLLTMLSMLTICIFSFSYWIIQYLMMLMFFFFFVYFGFNDLMFISYLMGVDNISSGMIMLSIWISSLMLMASEKIYFYNNYSSLFLMIILLLMITLYLSFSMMSLFTFYVFFESSLIPTLFLILGWGYQPERLQAGGYLLFYTLLASLPMLMGILYCYKIHFTMIFYLMNNVDLFYLFFYFSMMMAFLVKMPMYMFHLWLPQAHVEAPISGSMILAGVLLKLGGYGLFRIFPLLMIVNLKFNFFLIIISVLGGAYVSIMCMFQLDMKSLIAYSSVVHMSMVLCGLLTLSSWGLISSYILMISHGLCSSGLFCLSNINYERFMSRSMIINKGLISFMPSMSLWWFLFSMMNMACPPSMNLLGEIGLLNSIISWSWILMFMLIIMSFFSAVYSLYIYCYNQHGKFSNLIYIYSGGLNREYLLLFLHWYPLNMLILKSNVFLII